MGTANMRTQNDTKLSESEADRPHDAGTGLATRSFSAARVSLGRAFTASLFPWVALPLKTWRPRKACMIALAQVIARRALLEIVPNQVARWPPNPYKPIARSGAVGARCSPLSSTFTLD